MDVYLPIMTQKIGDYLKQKRQQLGFTLRVVEEKTGISNAYLSQLENNKIAEPSPKTLHTLAQCYDLPYQELLKLVGYPMASLVSEDNMGRAAAFRSSNSLGDITPNEEKKLSEYLAFLRSKRNV